MPSDYSLSTKMWADIIKEYQQVESVIVNSSTEKIEITIRKQKNILQFSREELDNSLNEFNGNPHEVVAFFLKKHGILVYYQDTLVALFDIQVYSSFIKKTSIDEAVNKTKDFIAKINSVSKTDILAVKLNHWILSDTVILVVDTNRHPLFSGSLEIFLGTCSIILRYGMLHGFPLRGAIGGGDFYKDGEIMVSSALVDANKYEKEQNWLGAVLTPRALDIIEKAKKFEIQQKGETKIDFTSNRFNPFIRYGLIPWKEGNSKILKPENAYYIKPFNMANGKWASNLPEYFNDQRKIKNSNCLYAQE